MLSDVAAAVRAGLFAHLPRLYVAHTLELRTDSVQTEESGISHGDGGK